MTHSSAARAAVEGYTRAWAREWAPDGVVGRRAGRRPLRHRVAAQVPRAGLARGRAHRAAAAPRPRGRARLARRARLLAARPRAVGLRDHARRRARQLVRPLAAAVADRRRGHRADRGTPPSRLTPPLRSDPGAGIISPARGRSVVAAQKPSKLLGRVRFPSPAPRPGSAPAVAWGPATGRGAVW